MSGTLQSAIASIRSGDQEAGQRLLAEVIRDDPRNETAWLWMSSVSNNDEYRRYCLERVLAINPRNETARRGLEALSQKQEAEPPQPEKQPEPTPPASTDALQQIRHIEQEATKKCPFCAETIKAESVVCRFCGKDLTTNQGDRQAPTTSPQPQKDIPAAPPPSQPSPASKVPPALRQFVSEHQDPVAVQQIHYKVSQILTGEERILYIAVQSHPLNLSPDAFVLTNRRFICYKPKLLGGVDFKDYIWRDLKDARLKEGIRAATITFKTVRAGGTRLVLHHLPKQQARRLYSIAQEIEEKVLEERRLRAMEEQRAAAGGIIVQGSVPGAVAQQPAPQEDSVARLKQLKAMLEADLITGDEYETKKKEILSRM